MCHLFPTKLILERRSRFCSLSLDLVLLFSSCVIDVFFLLLLFSLFLFFLGLFHFNMTRLDKQSNILLAASKINSISFITLVVLFVAFHTIKNKNIYIYTDVEKKSQRFSVRLLALPSKQIIRCSFYSGINICPSHCRPNSNNVQTRRFFSLSFCSNVNQLCIAEHGSQTMNNEHRRTNKHFKQLEYQSLSIWFTEKIAGELKKKNQSIQHFGSASLIGSLWFCTLQCKRFDFQQVQS